jgi:endogenous inhibitor of DNA gyrase (YacG/DUF329 family)
MRRFKCPKCSESVAEQDLLPHPPSEPHASRALAQTYCPACGTRVRISAALGSWRVLAVLGILACAFAVNFFMPTWVGRATVVVVPVLFLLITHNARRLVAVQT